MEKFGQHPLILARRGHHPVTPVRVCPCCKVAFHFHRTVLFPNSTGTTGEKGQGGESREGGGGGSEIGVVSGSSLKTFCIVSHTDPSDHPADNPHPRRKWKEKSLGT